MLMHYIYIVWIQKCQWVNICIESYDLEKFEQDILNDKIFGFFELDIKVPDNLKEYFSEMTPIFKNYCVPFDKIGNRMQEHYKSHQKLKYDDKGKKLIGSYYGNKQLFYSPLLKWYLLHGLEITKFHVGIQYKSKRCFCQFVQEVADARRTGDLDPNKKIIADTMKLIGNSPYGKTITNVFKHSKISYATNKNISKKINNRTFKDLEKLHGDNYEVDSSLSEIKINLPLQIGLAVYQLAKLRLLEFFYDFVDKYNDRSNYELLHIDTDSCYFVFASENIEDLIKPELRNEYEKDKYNFMTRTSQDVQPDCTIDGQQITVEAFELRKPGLFKEEARKNMEIAL